MLWLCVGTNPVWLYAVCISLSTFDVGADLVGSTVTTAVDVSSLSLSGIPVDDLTSSADSLQSSLASAMTSMVSVPLELIAAIAVDGRKDSYS